MGGSVVDRAVGIIIGAAFTAIVASLVNDTMNRFLGLLTGGLDFSNLFVPLDGQHDANLADAQRAGAAAVNIGLFLNAIIPFLIVSFAIFWVVKLLSQLHRRKDDTPPPAPTHAEELLAEIRDLVKVRV